MADKKQTVTLGRYKGLAVTRHVRPLAESAVEQELAHQCRLRAHYLPSAEAAKRGSRVTLDFEGYMDGEPIPDSKMENVTVLLGTGKLMPAAEQAIYGHKAGEVFRFDFTYPQDFRVEELSGLTAQFEIKLHAVAERQIPAADEAFAASCGYESLEAMREKIRADKRAAHEAAADRKAGKELLEMAGANLTAELPADRLAAEARREMRQLEARLKKSGIPLGAYCKTCRTTPEALRAGFLKTAETRMRSILAAKAIAEAEGIVVHKDEVEAEYHRLAAQHDTPEADIRKALPPDTIAAALASQKVEAFLLANARVTSVVDAPRTPAKKEG